MKLAVTKAQEQAISVLRLEALRRKIELEEAKEAYEKAAAIEKAVAQHVIDNNEYYADCPDILEIHSKRITDVFDTCFMNHEIFMNDYLPKVKSAFMELYGIDNPLNFVHSWPMHESKLKAERNYKMIAVEFLKICGRPEAAQLEESIKTYMHPEMERRLYKLIDDFVDGKAE
jgi:hypothetical protein